LRECSTDKHDSQLARHRMHSGSIPVVECPLCGLAMEVQNGTPDAVVSAHMDGECVAMRPHDALGTGAEGAGAHNTSSQCTDGLPHNHRAAVSATVKRENGASKHKAPPHAEADVVCLLSSDEEPVGRYTDISNDGQSVDQRLGCSHSAVQRWVAEGEMGVCGFSEEDDGESDGDDEDQDDEADSEQSSSSHDESDDDDVHASTSNMPRSHAARHSSTHDESTASVELGQDSVMANSDAQDRANYDELPEPEPEVGLCQGWADASGHANVWSSDEEDAKAVCDDEVIDLEQERYVCENECFAEELNCATPVPLSSSSSSTGASIIYAPSRKQVETIAAKLQERGYAAEAYHARMDTNHLRRVHAGFISGEITVVVATVAFGMGINRADVRNVIHYGWPQSLEQYFQEAGRAGRDGASANCVLYADLSVLPSLLPSKGRSYQQSKASCDALTALYKYAVRNGRCRQAQMLEYFDELSHSAQGNTMWCGQCDVCSNPRVAKRDFTKESVALVKAIDKFHRQSAGRAVRVYDCVCVCVCVYVCVCVRACKLSSVTYECMPAH
jgi:hypothetical protein